MLFDAASFFLIISAVMGSLISTVLAEIDNLKKSQDDARHEEALQQARIDGERTILASLNTSEPSPADANAFHFSADQEIRT